MSRIGKRPINVPSTVKFSLNGRVATMQGPQGSLSITLPDTPFVEVKFADGKITVTRREETPDARRQQGLVRALLQNQLVGVIEGYKKELDIVGVGYKAEIKGEELLLYVGYAYPKSYRIPKGLKILVEKNTRIFISGADKWQVGQAAAEIRDVRPPEPYQGKGIRYYEEKIRKKVGKAAVGTAAGGK